MVAKIKMYEYNEGFDVGRLLVPSAVVCVCILHILFGCCYCYCCCFLHFFVYLSIFLPCRCLTQRTVEIPCENTFDSFNTKTNLNLYENHKTLIIFKILHIGNALKFQFKS